MKTIRQLVRETPQRDAERTALERLATRAPRQPREINALEYLAYCLNGIPRMAPQTAKYWRMAETIATEWLRGDVASMRRSLEQFNRWAASKPLSVGVHPEHLTDKYAVGMWLSMDITTPHDGRDAIFIVWKTFFLNVKRPHLKRCPECHHWFVDKTRNGSMVRCSTSCTNKWWTLERRREAGHNVPGATRRGKRRATR